MKSRIYLYDGTYYGLMSLLAQLLKQKEIAVEDIISIKCYKPSFIYEFDYIKTDYERAKKLIQFINQRFGNKIYKKIYNCYLSEWEKREINIFEYLKLLLLYGKKIIYDYSKDCVVFIEKSSQRVMREYNKLLGLLRFAEGEDGFYYCKFEADTDVLYYLANFFKKRFSNQKFIIFDAKRKKACFHSNGYLKILSVNNLNINMTKNEIQYQKMWKGYFKALTIKERQNLKLQKQNMPKKYWKYLIEKG